MENWHPPRRAAAQERRSELRQVCEGAAVMDVLSPSPRRGIEIRVLDVASASLKLSVPFFISPGSIVRIYLTQATAQAEVRYCTREGPECHIGVRLEEIEPKA